MGRILLVVFLMMSLGVDAQTAASRSYDYLFHEAMLQRQRGHHDAAFDLLTRCAEIDSMASETYYFLSQYYTEMRQNDKEMACIERAVRLEPQNKT